MAIKRKVNKQAARAAGRGRSVGEGPQPAIRRMTVIAQDPGVLAADGEHILMATALVPAEDLIPGPVGYRVQVVDFDSSSQEYHGAHILPAAHADEPKAWRRGDPSILKEYRFHAQNVYALVMQTLARFEFALGRRIGWSFPGHQLKIAPHGLIDANAFYSPQIEGLVLGHFEGCTGGKVFTALSHDVVVHETSHALVDALHERYLDPSGPDQAAFHEGFADVVALLSVFAQSALTEELLRRGAEKPAPPGLIDTEDLAPKALARSALFLLAEQLGQECGEVRGGALRRSTELIKSPRLLKDPEYQEPHRRGEILVAAVLDAFVKTWSRRVARRRQPFNSLAEVAEEGADVAGALLTMWIRALDYMPPVHLVFGDALSAALTADLEVRPADRRFGLRSQLLSSFISFGIVPTSRRQDLPGVWMPAPAGLKYDRVRFESMRSDRDEIFRFIWENRKALDVQEGAYTEVLSVRPCTRQGEDGFVLHETVAEYYQVARLTPEELREKRIKLPAGYLERQRQVRQEALRTRARRRGAPGVAEGDTGAGEEDQALDAVTPVYGGGVLLFDEYGKLKYHVKNDVFSRKQTARLAHLWEAGQLKPGARSARLAAARFSALHRQRALGVRRFPEQGW